MSRLPAAIDVDIPADIAIDITANILNFAVVITVDTFVDITLRCCGPYVGIGAHDVVDVYLGMAEDCRGNYCLLPQPWVWPWRFL